MASSHLFLIGYRGSGKSSVGRALSTVMDRPFVDTDASVEDRVGKSIAEIFLHDGETVFRDLESEAIASLKVKLPSVVSLGGGAILRPANRQRLRELGRSVWLRASATCLADRIAADEARGNRRPSLTGVGVVEEIEHVLAEREPLYRDTCDWELETSGRDPTELARTIADWYASLSDGIET
jgi:shikimate kinase